MVLVFEKLKNRFTEFMLTKIYKEKEILYNDYSSPGIMITINRVLFINHNIPPYEYSGTPIITLNHAIGMRKKNVEVAILIPSAEIKDGYVKEVKEDYTLYKVPQLEKYEAYFGNVNQIQLNKYTYSIEKIIHEFQPQIVHINDYVFMPEVIVTLLANSGAYIIRNVFNPEEICHLDSPVYLKGKKEVLCSGPDAVEKCANCYMTNVLKKSNNEIDSEQLKKYSRKTQRRFEAIRSIYKEYVDGIIFPDRSFKKYFRQFIGLKDNIDKVIELGFIFDKPRRFEYKKEPKGVIHIGFIGNLIPRKGINIILEAFEKIINLENFICDIYGANDLKIYQDLIERFDKRYPDKIKYHGIFNYSDIESIADTIDFAIIPSHFETFNRVVRELMFFGVPIVATDFFGSSIVEDGFNGIKIKVGDSNALADSIKELILNPSLIEKLSKGVINTPIASLEDEINEIYGFYTEVAAKKKIKKKMLSTYDKILMAEDLIEKGNTKKARKILDEVLSVYDENIDALNDLAVVYIVEKDYFKALDHINRVLKIDSKNLIAITNLINLKEIVNKQIGIENKSEYNLVSKEEKTVYNFSQDNIKSYISSNGNREMYDNIFENQNGNFLTAVKELIEQQNFEKTQKELDLILKEDPKNIDALNNLAFIDLLKKDYKKAFQIISNILVENPIESVARNNLRYIHEEFHDYLSDFDIKFDNSNGFNAKAITKCPLCSEDSYLLLIKKNHPYYTCINCEAIFTPKLKQDVLITNNNGDAGRHNDEVNSQRLERIKKYSGNEIKRIIDFGCGNGQFTNFLKDRGYFCIGIDQETKLQLRDIDSESIDSVAMIEVIEHINEPVNIFREFKRILKKGGLVYIESSFVSNKNLKLWPYLDPAIGHSFIHSEKSIKLLAEYLDLGIIQINKNVYIISKNITDQRYQIGEMSCDVSIIIPVYNQSFYTQNCLNKIYENTLSKKSYEIIIVDNASEDNTCEVVESFRKKFPDIKYVRNKQNLKFAKACNIGAGNADGKYLIFLNNDTEVQKGWLENAIKRLEMDDNIGIVGAKLLYPDRTIQHCGIVFVRSYDKEIPVWPVHRFRGADENYPGVLKPKKLHAVTGACMFIRKELFIKLNGFDENYGMYFEDIDLCFKATQLGKSIIYEPNCVVIHHEGKSGTNRKDIDEQNDKASKVFYRKWCNQIIKLLKNGLEREIFWIAPFFNPSGYASEAINFALGLDKYIHLTIRNQNPMISDEFINNIPDRWKKTLFRLHRIDPHKWSDDFSYLGNSIFIHHQPGNNLTRFKNSAYGIGRTMYETDRIPSSWVDKCNQMDEIWVPSKFNVSTFSKSGVDKNKLVVIPESIDTDILDPDKVNILELPNRANFNFLSIFEWTNRKGWDILLNAYFKTFKKEDDVCLYLRTYLLSNYDVDTKKLIQDKISLLIEKGGYKKEELPRIELLTKQLPFNDILRLYKSADAFVLPSRGEGWGRPYMEAMAMALPVIGTNWSGNTEFMTNENSYLIDIEELIEIKGNEINSYIGHKWAQPSEGHLIKILKHIYHNPQEAKKKGLRARQDIIKNFNLDVVAKIIVDRLNKIDEKIKLDELNKISSKKRILNSDISIIWEGAQFVNSSLALVNRELCTSIVKANFNLSLIKTEGDQFKPFPESSYYNLLGKEKANQENTDLHVRHQWPPNLNTPDKGRWVVIQPWEFGSLPQDWVEVFLKSVDEMWVPSNYVRQVYIDSGVPGDRVFVVPNGFDPEVFNPNVKQYSLPTKKKFKFIFVGGTIYRKGIDLLLQAYCEVFTNDDDVSLIIKDMGGNSFYKGQNFKDLILELKNKKGTPEIIYIDKELNEKEIAGLYTACDVLVHPFRGEGFGLPILEAMASGVPVIVTAGGSAADFCNSENSLLINSKKEYLKEKRIGEYKTVDYPWILQPSLDDLKEKILFAYKNPDAMKTLSRKAFESVSQKWTWENAFKILQNRILEISSKPILRENNDEEKLDADKQLEIAENYISENKLNDARLILKNILEYKPDNIDALNNLSVIEILESNFEAGLRLIEKIIDQDPANKIAKSNLEYIETELCKTNFVK